MSEKILDIKEERLSFFTPAGEVKALNGVSFAMNQGDVLGIVGESGSGKSVTAYSVMGLTAYPGKLVGGTVWFNGHEIEKMKEKDFRKIRGNEVSIIFQDPMTSLNPVYTIGNQIVEVIRLHTKKNKQEAWARAEELLELVGINEPEKRLKQYPHELSGQKSEVNYMYGSMGEFRKSNFGRLRIVSEGTTLDQVWLRSLKHQFPRSPCSSTLPRRRLQ